MFVKQFKIQNAQGLPTVSIMTLVWYIKRENFFFIVDVLEC